LPRAKQTAEIIANGRDIPIILDENISVREFGEHKGKIANVNSGFTHGFWSYKANIKYKQA
jgi:broad specificity phosphatase PhoE